MIRPRTALGRWGLGRKEVLDWRSSRTRRPTSRAEGRAGVTSERKLTINRWVARISILVVLVGAVFAIVRSTRAGDAVDLATAGDSLARTIYGAATPSTVQPVTLLQAWDIGLSGARSRWDAAALVTEVHSVPNSSEVGVLMPDGTRQQWTVVAASPNFPSDRVQIEVVQGIIASIVLIAGPSVSAPISAKPLIDSPEAIRTSKANKRSLVPDLARDTTYGYHLAVRDDGRPEIIVSGRFLDSEARVSVDAVSGQVIDAAVYIPVRGGIIHSGDAGSTWHLSQMPGEGDVMDVCTDPVTPRKAFAVRPGLTAVEVLETTDGGSDWASLGWLPQAAGSWGFSIECLGSGSLGPALAVGTNSGLWLTSSGKSWHASGTAPSGPVQFQRRIGAGASQTLVVSITAGPNAGIYESSDLQNWAKLVGGSYRLFRSSDDGEVFGTSLDPQSWIVRIARAGVTQISTPVPMNRVAGSTAPSAQIVASDGGSIYRSTDSGKSWSVGSAATAYSLAISPSSAGAPVILVSGNATSLSKSTDGVALHNVEASGVPGLLGNGDLTNLTFLSDVDVIAVEDGIPAWVSW